MAANVSRSSGVASLAVFFDADAAASSGSTRPFHHRRYVWDFDDDGAGTWAYSGKSKETADGPLAAHVYETPGTYNATLTVYESGAVIDTDEFEIVVSDPDTVFAGELTICVSDVAHDDFTGAPSGCVELTTDDLADIIGYINADPVRVLLHRGSSWTVAWTVETVLFTADNHGPISIGAYGEGSNPNELGIYENAPVINFSGNLFTCGASGWNGMWDWRIADITFAGDDWDLDGAFFFHTAIDMRQMLCLRCKVTGTHLGIGWSHWRDTSADYIDQVAIFDCDLSRNYYENYVNGERIALMGNHGYDGASAIGGYGYEGAHIVRSQTYKLVISHCKLHSPTIDETNYNAGQILKLHAPAENLINPDGIEGTFRYGGLYSVIQDNVFGAGGLWPIQIGPQTGEVDERVIDLIFERNRLHGDYGTQAYIFSLASFMHLWCTYATMRNNIFDAGSIIESGYNTIGIVVEQRAGTPPQGPIPEHIEIFNNTFYFPTDSGETRFGVTVSAVANDIVARNNGMYFPGGEDAKDAFLVTAGGELDATYNTSDENLMQDPDLLDPANATPLSRDFRLDSDSEWIDAGTTVPVYDEFAGTVRWGTYEMGAYVYGSGVETKLVMVLR